MLNQRNQILSRLHKMAAIVVITLFIYKAVYRFYVDIPQYSIGYFLGVSALIFAHFVCARSVKTGSTSSRFGSIFMTVFMLNNFPIGTVIAVMILFFSLFKWEKGPTFKLPIELQKS
ncbi:hypothetical protein [Acinetobacter dispersus]|uniref:Uncharacterized protein n=1 Tax=Acinetobacter dispersus TaxID=70348 RepID=N9LLQ8_9GAMM|nr:hypothetical protein F904_00036 [Acinetobacter dispersus]QHH96390.1 hypothetical protein FPL17_02095 [Acinetobacter dispersus]